MHVGRGGAYIKCYSCSFAAAQEDIELRELRDFNTTVVQQLGSLGQADSQLASTISLLLSQASSPAHLLCTHHYHLPTLSALLTGGTAAPGLSHGQQPKQFYVGVSTEFFERQVIGSWFEGLFGGGCNLASCQFLMY